MDTYYNQSDYDAQAKQMYRALLEKWVNRANPSFDKPDDNCLAVARTIFCAHSFRRCRDYLAPKQPLCPWICQLLRERCPDQKETIKELCATESDEVSCSRADGFIRHSVVALALSALALVFSLA